jgi:DNA-binding NarL/FixJ family response regulator
MEKLRILLAEDHQIVREGLKALINAQADMQVVGEAENGVTALHLAHDLTPDIIIMDISMPKMNGLEATKNLRKVSPRIKILTLTRHANTGFMQQLFRAGASGYVLKQSASDQLPHAIRTIAAGDNYLDPAITGKVMEGYAGKFLSTNFVPSVDISEREEEVLKMVAWGYSNKEIAGRLDISVKTVEAHKTNFMKKLDFRSRIDIVRYALLRGWLNDH